MSISELEKKENSVESALDKPKYPYGLRLRIDQDTFKKLRLGKPEIGATMLLSALVEVSEVSSEKMFGDDDNFSMELQITSMELTKNESDKENENVVDVMYGSN